MGGDLEVEPLGEVLGAVERHEDDGGAGSHGPGTHDHCKHTQKEKYLLMEKYLLPFE